MFGISELTDITGCELHSGTSILQQSVPNSYTIACNIADKRHLLKYSKQRMFTRDVLNSYTTATTTTTTYNNNNNDDNNNNNRTERRNSKCFTIFSLLRGPYAQVAGLQSCANHVQRIQCLSRATRRAMCHVARRYSSAIKFDRV